MTVTYYINRHLYERSIEVDYPANTPEDTIEADFVAWAGRDVVWGGWYQGSCQ